MNRSLKSQLFRTTENYGCHYKNFQELFCAGPFKHVSRGFTLIYRWQEETIRNGRLCRRPPSVGELRIYPSKLHKAVGDAKVWLTR